MRSNRRRDTKSELAVRRALHAAGMRYFVDRPVATRSRAVRADIVFPRARLAVFIDGCFWHGCPVHGTMPARNRDYWAPKIARNSERDAEQTRRLETVGWTVARFWEHESPEVVVEAIARLLADRRERPAPA
jgi:DNA mismatch endonuclease (patch repair protein)